MSDTYRLLLLEEENSKLHERVEELERKIGEQQDIMKHKNSILLCELDDGSVDLFVNGAHVLRDRRIKTGLRQIANSTLTFNRLTQILFDTHELLHELELPPK